MQRNSFISHLSLQNEASLYLPFLSPLLSSRNTGRKKRLGEGGWDGETAGSEDGGFLKPLRAIRRNSFQRGQATLEILIVLLILIPLIFGGIELSRGVAVRAALDSGVGVAVQAISIDPTQWGWSANVVATTVANNVLGCPAPCTVHLEAYDSSNQLLTDPASELLGMPYGAPFCLVGWMNFSPMIPLVPLPAPGHIKIQVRHCGIIQRIG